jgi:N-acetylglutamate synthase-like GNAT family acetyltransferase
MEIQKAQKNDLEEILELQKTCYKENALRYNDFKIPPMTQTIDQIKTEFESGTILKAIENGQIVGSIRAFEKDGSCYIGRVIVHPDFQNKGIGRQLMVAIEQNYKDISRFELFTGNKDEKNLYFYQKLGYKPFKQVEVNKEISMVYLEKMD